MRQLQEVNKLTNRDTSTKKRYAKRGVDGTGPDHLTGSRLSDTLATDLWYTRVGVGVTKAPQAPSAWPVPGYVAMCSTWPQTSAQRPFVLARVASWGLPLIPGQLFISEGRGRARKKESDRERDKQKEWGVGVEKRKSTSAANYWKNIKVCSVCLKRKKRGKMR